MIEVGAAEIEEVGTLYNAHVKREQLVVEITQLRNIAAADFADAELLQPQVDISFTKIRFFVVMDLERDGSKSGLACREINDTMSSKSKFIAEHQAVLVGVLLCSVD